MNKYYWSGVFTTGLLGLLASYIPLRAIPAAAEDTDAAIGKLEISHDALANPTTADDNASVAQTQNEATALSKLSTNLNSTTTALVKSDASSPEPTSSGQNRQPNDNRTIQ